MATRKIKDAKDLTTNELIYFKGHAKATYMSDGRTVEDAINNINIEAGPQGPQGEQGPKGEDGVGIASVAQTTTSSADGGSNVVTVTLSDGKTSTFSVKNGSKGSQGEKGDKGDKGDTGTAGANGTNGTNGKDGANGATFTPSVDADGNLSWTNDKGLANPATVNIKGPKGDSGDSGEGGGSSGEDNRYFTEFTVGDFMEGCKNYDRISEDVTELLEAARNNKIICFPDVSGCGFDIARYEYIDNDQVLNIYLERNGAVYSALATDWLEGINVVYNRPIVNYVYGTEPSIEANSNCIYICKDLLTDLTVVPATYNGPATIRFMVKINYSLTLTILGTVYWANGIIPSIEGTETGDFANMYELSLFGSDQITAVLTPFKYVE